MYFNLSDLLLFRPPPSSHTLLKAIDTFEYKLTKSKHRTFKINEINFVEVFKIRFLCGLSIFRMSLAITFKNNASLS